MGLRWSFGRKRLDLYIRARRIKEEIMGYRNAELASALKENGRLRDLINKLEINKTPKEKKPPTITQIRMMRALKVVILWHVWKWILVFVGFIVGIIPTIAAGYIVHGRIGYYFTMNGYNSPDIDPRWLHRFVIGNDPEWEENQARKLKKYMR
jgi:hypothetical protein